MTQAQTSLNQIVDRIAENYSPEKIILFGSQADGTSDEDSDYDLLIIKEDRSDFFEEQKRVREIIEGELAADILIYTPSEVEKRLSMGDFFMENIVNKGQVLYEQ